MTSAANTGKPTSELATEVGVWIDCDSMAASNARDALDALVARVADLEAENARLERVADNLVIAADVEKEKREAAEAQVAALSTENLELHDVWKQWKVRAEAAEAALAEADEIIRRVAEGDMPEGGVTWLHGKTWRINLAREYIARRALAAADTTKEE